MFNRVYLCLLVFTLVYLFATVYSSLPMFTMFTPAYLLSLHSFTYAYSSTYVYYVYSCMFKHLCLHLFTYVYHCLLLFTFVFHWLLVLVFLCLPNKFIRFCLCLHLFTYDYPRLLVFTYVCQCVLVSICYSCMFTKVDPCILVFTYVYACLLMFITVYSCLTDYSCWRMFNIRPCLTKFKNVYIFFRIFTLVNQRLPLFTGV